MCAAQSLLQCNHGVAPAQVWTDEPTCLFCERLARLLLALLPRLEVLQDVKNAVSLVNDCHPASQHGFFTARSAALRDYGWTLRRTLRIAKHRRLGCHVELPVLAAWRNSLTSCKNGESIAAYLEFRQECTYIENSQHDRVLMKGVCISSRPGDTAYRSDQRKS